MPYYLRGRPRFGWPCPFGLPSTLTISAALAASMSCSMAWRTMALAVTSRFCTIAIDRACRRNSSIPGVRYTCTSRRGIARSGCRWGGAEAAGGPLLCHSPLLDRAGRSHAHHSFPALLLHRSVPLGASASASRLFITNHRKLPFAVAVFMLCVPQGVTSPPTRSVF